MNITFPWPPLVLALIISFLALSAAVLLCNDKKLPTKRVAVAAFVPWFLGFLVALIGEMSPMSGSGPFWLWLSIFTVLCCAFVQFLFIWKYLGLRFTRALFAVLIWGITIILFVALVVLIVRVTDSSHMSVDIK